MVTGTLGASLRNSAAVSSVRTWVWVSIVRTMLISPPQRRHPTRGHERPSDAPTPSPQAPLGARPCRYNRGSHPSNSGIRMTTPPRTRQTPRVEDNALVRGAGHFMDDPRLPKTAYAAFVRSPHAHARVVAVKTDEARKAKKVLAVL